MEINSRTERGGHGPLPSRAFPFSFWKRRFEFHVQRRESTLSSGPYPTLAWNGGWNGDMTGKTVPFGYLSFSPSVQSRLDTVECVWPLMRLAIPLVSIRPHVAMPLEELAVLQKRMLGPRVPRADWRGERGNKKGRGLSLCTVQALNDC